MIIERRIHPNCSEWDDEVLPDNYKDYLYLSDEYKPIIETEIKEQDWDADRNGN
jgi:hypothetical protein